MKTNRHLPLVLTIACLLAIVSVVFLLEKHPAMSRSMRDVPPVQRSDSQITKPELVVQTGHSLSVDAVAYSPDGKVIASGGGDSMTKLWDAASGQLLRTLPIREFNVSSVAFSPDSKMVVCGNYGNTIKLWDITTGQLIRTYIGHTSMVNLVCFSPNGKTLVSGGEDNTIRLWDVETGRLLKTLTGHTKPVESVAFSPDGEKIVSGSRDGTVRLWDAATGQMKQALTGHTDCVRSVCFSPDGKTLASGSSDKTIKLWDAATGQLLRTLTGHTEENLSVVFSPDGKTLASGGELNSHPSGSLDGTVNLWDVASGQLLRTLTQDIGFVNSVCFSPDGKTLVSGHSDSTIKIWDATTGHLLRNLRGQVHTVTSVAFTPDGKTLACGSNNGVIDLQDPATGQLLRTLPGHTKGVAAVAFSPDGRTLASGGAYDQTIKLWDVATGHMLRTLTGHTNSVNSVAFSSDGRIIASGSMDKTIKLWDAATGQLLRTLMGSAQAVMSVAFSPDGKTLASGSIDSKIDLWDVATGQQIRLLTGNFSEVTSVAFSPDGRTLASGINDKTIRLWDIITGKQIRTLIGHTDRVTSVTFSPDGSTLASGAGDFVDKADSTIKLWDAATGQLLRTLTGHTNGVTAVVFSPDGRTLASGSWDNTLKLWDAATGLERATLYAFDGGGWAVITPDGRFDGNDAGLQNLHYVVGLEPIGLSQLKDRYYEPGLLSKLLGFNKEPLRDVSAFDHVDLTPAMKAPAAVPAAGKLTLALTNRGGGIGRVQVFVNGKELTADARGATPDPDAPIASVTVDVSHAPGLVPGKPNTVRVVTWNKQGYLSSRGTALDYTPPGRADAAPPELWAVVAGSDYHSLPTPLTYPAKDAADFAHALTLAADNLFGASRVHVTLLDSLGQPGALPPTKANLQAAFAAARKAKPGDVFLVYLAGHGVALPGGGADDAHDLYCYLTDEATTGAPASLAHDATLRTATTVSSEELTDWIKLVPAQKQVMVLDTCAAGAAAALLTQKRDVPSDQIRAIDRLKDRTGFYVLMGCAADSVSYEASRYRQGLLTYSLLKGMKGASLREDKYVDVSALFNYAVDEVPQLAQGIGGVQKPFVAAPSAGSFDVGELSPADRNAIPLASVGAMLLRPELVSTGDDLGLEALLTARLRAAASPAPRGDGTTPAAPFSLLDTDSFAGAIQPQGTYTVTGPTVAVTLRLRRDGKVVKTIQLSGPRSDLPGLAAKLSAAIIGSLGMP